MRQWPSHQGLHLFSVEEEEDNDGKEVPFADVNELEASNQRRTNNNEKLSVCVFCFVFVKHVC